MALAFRSVAIPGLHGELKFSPWDVQVSRTQFFAVQGESELRGDRGGRDIKVESIWYSAPTGYTTAAQLEAAIELLNKDCPINGTLAETGAISRTLQRCTLMGVAIKLGPLPSAHLGWWAQVEIMWRQLAP